MFTRFLTALFFVLFGIRFTFYPIPDFVLGIAAFAVAIAVIAGQ
jgi:hypothetical protein